MPGHGYFGGVRLLHVCSVPECPNLTEGSRCAEHVRGSDRRSRRYRQTRELVLERDGYRCQAVALGANPAECSGGLQAHHLLDVALGGTDEPENMVALCRSHNNMARRSKPPRWLRALERHGPPALARSPAPAGAVGPGLRPGPPRPGAGGPGRRVVANVQADLERIAAELRAREQ